MIEAQQSLAQTTGRYLFYVKKGFALLQVLKTKGSQESLDQLRVIRQEAIELKQWESLRDCDLFEALATENKYLLRKVLLGTPHASYRRRVSAMTETPSTNSVFELQMDSGYPNGSNGNDCFDGPDGSAEVKTLSVTEGIGSNGESLARRPVLHSLLQALFLDFYKPAKLGFIFRHLFPEENFNPISSPARVFAAIHNLNVWLQSSQTPLHIKIDEGEFHLQVSSPLKVIVESRKIKAGKALYELTRLQSVVGFRTFKANDVLTALQLSKPTVLGILREGLRNKKLIKIGQGRSTLYRFT